MFKTVINLIVNIIRFIYSPSTAFKLRVYFNRIYTLWMSKEFSSLGRSSNFVYPLYLKGGRFITIGKNFGCDSRFRIDAFDSYLEQNFEPKIIIGDNVSIQKDCHIGAINKITIGNNVLIASKVYISDHSHGEVNREELLVAPAIRKLYSKGEILIENNVWIGESVVILPNVTIGENSIVGANSVVSKSIPKNSVAVGNPARIIKQF